MDWIESEALRFFCPVFADELIGCEAFEGIESADEVVGGDEPVQVAAAIARLGIMRLDERLQPGPPYGALERVFRACARISSHKLRRDRQHFSWSRCLRSSSIREMRPQRIK